MPTSESSSSGSAPVENPLDQLPVAALVVDRQAGLVEANAQWCSMAGAASSPGRHWIAPVSYGHRDDVLDAVRRTIHDGRKRCVDAKIETSDGARWTRWWIGPAPTGASMVVADVDQEHAERAELRRRALHDPLTGPVDRAHFAELTDRALERHRRSGGRLAVLFLDLDGFKEINDGEGHAEGDAVLVGVARALEQALRPGDVLARVGGDEFAVMCDHMRAVEDVAAVADRIRAALSRPVLAHGHVWPVSATGGIAYSRPGDTAASVVDRADRAMYAAKHRGPGARVR